MSKQRSSDNDKWQRGEVKRPASVSSLHFLCRTKTDANEKYLILHKDEWERIKRQHRPCEDPNIGNEYIHRMQELSQEWIKSWPDTIKGHIEILKKIEARKRKKDIEEIKRFAVQKKKDSSKEAIQKARKIIFEDSCYGKQLISCLIESKTLEEREAQLKFQKKIKERTVKDEKETILKEKQRNRELENRKMEKLRQKQTKDREIAEINKTMYEIDNAKNIRDKETQIQTELEDMKIIKNLLDNETKRRIKDKIDVSKQMLQDNVKHCQYKKQLEENRAKEQENNKRINKLWHEYYDRVRRKKNVVHEEVKKKDSYKKMQLFQNLERIKKIEENKYKDFVDKGIKRLEQKLNEENKHKEGQKKNTENNKLVAINSIIEQEKTQKKQQNKNTQKKSKVCHCDRQTIVSKPSKKNSNARNFKNDESLQLLKPLKSLGDELKKREKEPFPWSGTQAAHEQFAQEAGKILGECRYKTMARKVVDEYRKINSLNTNNLPVTNYL